jgi:4-hydroxybenzoate polyprenyltransferase
MLLDGTARADRATTLRALLSAAHPGPAFGVTVMVGVLALAVGLEPVTAMLVVAAVLTGQLSIGWSNDLIDLARDLRTGRSDKPLATGAIAPGPVRVACRSALAATVVLSLALGWLPGGAQLVSVAAGWAYNLRLKSTVWSWLPYAVAFGALAAVPSLALPVVHVPWWQPVVGALLGVGAHLLNVLPDLDDDAATGVAGLPHRLAARVGATGVAALAVVLLLTASGLLLAAVPRGPGVWVTAVLVLGLAVLALVSSGRTPFRAAMAIALVDVVLLAVAL